MTQELPGQLLGRTATFRDCLLSTEGLTYGRGVIDSSLAYDGSNTGYETVLRVGTPMAKITASGLWVPCKFTQVNMTGATATAITVDDTRAFKVGDVITVGGDTTITITAINHTTHVITIASTTVADNDAFFAEDGSGICRGILNEEIDLYEDFSRGVVNKEFGQLIIAGLVDQRKVLGDIAGIRAYAGSKIGFIQFGDDAGQTAA